MSGMLAKVMNSSVGTSNFKSLDEILVFSKSLKASDEVYSLFPNSLTGDMTVFNGNSSKDICTFKMPLNGSVKLVYNMGFGSSGPTGSVKVNIYKNGTLYQTSSSTFGIYDTTNNPTRSAILEGNRGDVFKINLTASGTSYTPSICLRLYSLNATVVDGETMQIQSLM